MPRIPLRCEAQGKDARQNAGKLATRVGTGDERLDSLMCVCVPAELSNSTPQPFSKDLRLSVWCTEGRQAEARIPQITSQNRYRSVWVVCLRLSHFSTSSPLYAQGALTGRPRKRFTAPAGLRTCGTAAPAPGDDRRR
jgi:hypothetical protein